MEEQEDQSRVRLQKLEAMRAHGCDPFAVERFDRTHTARLFHDDTRCGDGEQVTVVGRIVSMRSMGKSTFLHLEDETGRIQIYFKLDRVGPDAYERLDWLDLGDHLGVTGEVFRTRTGEKS